MPSAELSLPPDAASVSAARRFLTGELERWGVDDLAWAGAQVVSELATNAVLHARSGFLVRLELDGSVLRIAVRDSSTVPPNQRHYGDSATTGRGLNLLQELARSWGTDPEPDGKWVWAELDAADGDRIPGLTEGVDLPTQAAPTELLPRQDGGGAEASGHRLIAA